MDEEKLNGDNLSDNNEAAEEKDESELHRILYGGEYSEYKEDIDMSEEEKEERPSLSTFEDIPEDEEKKPKSTVTKKRKQTIKWRTVPFYCAFPLTQRKNFYIILH